MRVVIIYGMLIGAVIWPGSAVEAQFLRNRFDPPIPPETMRVTSEIDRNVQSVMDDASLLIKQQQFVPAVMRLQAVLDYPEDFFLYKEFDRRNVPNIGMKAQTHQILADLPTEGRAAYELHFGITARSLLNDAILSHNLEKMAEVVQRYQTTAAGYDAMQILAATAFDHDHPVEAALLCEAITKHPQVKNESKGSQLLRTAFAWHLAGDRKRTLDALNALKKTDSPDNWQIGERQLPPLSGKSGAAEWLAANFGAVVRPHVRTVAEWSKPLGGASGNESATPAFPVGGEVWSISPLQHMRLTIDSEINAKLLSQVDRMVHYIEGALHDHGRMAQLAAMPIVVGNVVVYRTLNDVTAVNLKTGQLQWRSSLTDGSLLTLSQKLPEEYDVNSMVSPTDFSGYIQNRLFRDQLSGTLSSDGKYVYAIEEIESFHAPIRPRRQRMREQYFAPPTSKLVAYELETGRLVWEVGGMRGTPPAELSGSFFLGPPLPFAGRLYCITEMKDEIRLVSLISENDSVRMEWSQSLIALHPMTSWRLRRQAGVMPAIVDGLIVCPTSTGSVVAYDLLRRQLRWGYSYETPRSPHSLDRNDVPVFPHVEDTDARWLDRGPLLSNGRVILTPVDSPELHCLNLVDGSLVWRQPRRQGSYVACIHDDAVIVVGRTQIVAYSLAKGEKVWEQPLEIPEPSGRGVRVDSTYLLPLSNGEIATIDLVHGRILGRSRLSDGHIPGNLAVCEGTLVSLGIHDVVGFRSLPEMEQQIARLPTNPKDAEALALRGELRLHRGEQDDGVNDLRESLRLMPHPRVKRVLAGTLMTGLAKDPVRFLKAASELESLIDEPRQRIEFLRSYIRLLNESGDRVAAVKQLFRLGDIPKIADEMIYETPGYSITLWQNVRSQLLTIYEAATPDQRAEIDQIFTREFEKVIQAKNRDQRLLSFVKLTSHLPRADEFLQQLVESKNALVDDANQTKILEQLTRSRNKSIAANAIVRLAKKALDNNSPRDCLPWISQLSGDYSSQVCFNGKTGLQIANEWLARDDVRRSKVAPATWPEGPIQVEVSRERKEFSAFPVMLVTHVGPYFANWTFEIDANNGLFKARDPSLRIAWQLPHASFKEASRGAVVQLHIRGVRLALSCGTQLIVMEGTESSTPPKILFEETLQSNGLADRRMPEPQKRPLLPNGRRFDILGSEGFLIGLSDEAVFYRMDNRLVSVEVETGDVLWTRMGAEFVKSDATVGSILTLHTSNQDAILLRPLDGIVVQQYKGNRDEISLWFRGTRRLSENRGTKDQQVFEMRDFDGDQVVWQSQHPAGTLPFIVNREEFAILEPSGKFSVLNLTTGATVVDAEIPLKRPVGKSGELAVQRFDSRYIVFAGIPTDRSNYGRTTTRNFGLSADATMTVDGYVCAINQKDGHVDWTVPVEQLAYDFGQATNMPVLVLASRQSEIAALRQQFPAQRLSVMVLDKRNGSEVYKAQELLSPTPTAFSPIGRGVQCIPMIDEKQLTIDFQDWSLELSFSGESK